MKNLAFFTGGGSKGIAQVGMYKAALDLNIKFDAFIGISAGALNASILANDNSYKGIDILYELWKDFDSGIKKTKTANFIKLLFVGNIGKISSLEERVDLLKGRDLSSTNHPLAIITTRVKDLSTTIWDKGEMSKILLASTAIPGVYPPVVLDDGFEHFDGGVGSINPVDIAKKIFPKYNIYIFDVTGEILYKPNMKPMELLGYVSAINQRNIAKYNNYDRTVKRHIRLPLPFSEIDPLDFNYYDELLNIGYKFAKVKLSEK